MKGYVISGIQQIGIGVNNLREAWNWYINHFGMDCRAFEDDGVAKLMLPYTAGEPRRRQAVLAMNLQSGGGFEIWQYKEREPLRNEAGVSIGDLGIIACKIKSKNVAETLRSFQAKGTMVPPILSEDPSGQTTFFMKDPYDNLFQVVKGDDWFMNEKKLTGGSFGAIIGVSDIDKSRRVYSDILGYDRVIYDKTGIFGDLKDIPGGKNECRRVLLGRTGKFMGPVSRLFGNSFMELICTPGKPGRNIYEGRLWGDPGFIHLCFDMRGMDELRKYCEKSGYPFTVDSMQSHDGSSFDMGEAAGYFSYIQDPDGTLIEFVETHKIPVLKKFGLFLDLRKRPAEKPLPDWMLKTLKFSRVKNR